MIKDAAVLEVLEGVDTLVVDKTGTLTQGHPHLTEIISLPSAIDDPPDEATLLSWVAAVEQNSEHPLGQAIVREAERRQLTLPAVDDFDVQAGNGVRASVAGHDVVVGKAAYLKQTGFASLDEAQSRRAVSTQGSTVVFVGLDGNPAALLVVNDPIKEATPAAIRRLKQMGLTITMLTGDTARSAQVVADRLGIDHVEAGVNPTEKHRHIAALRAAGQRVAMAGDGINDAPALAEADVGIAMGTGTDVAIQSAGVTLLQGNLSGIAKAITLSRSTMRNIRQNLFFAFVYNAIGVPLAAGVLVPLLHSKALLNPMIAAAAMSMSSVSVITNALRLRHMKLT